MRGNKRQRPSENCNAFFRRPHFSYSAKYRRLQNRVRRLGGTPYRTATLPAVPKQCRVCRTATHAFSRCINRSGTV
ncbi:hypothetical protein [Kingella potus]|uniref:hypothetical protein n=1 Tax=Kingella potus TaxID=265175 RepID=UPI001FD295F0|nr:hypothetical protein [Kingella potus]UOP00159.1 hypothetical protein LVJ84_09420 [Kingella potus]